MKISNYVCNFFFFRFFTSCVQIHRKCVTHEPTQFNCLKLNNIYVILKISWKVPPRTDTDELKRKMDLAIRANQNQAAEQKMGLNLSNCSRYLNEISFLLTLFEMCCYDISHGLLTSRGLMSLRK